ncbi:RagB/SusD family nutrient uptake outer membrane protein [Flavobacterium sp. ANB]|uniref:RagB/SusD family nutrient uptake outer membrane protein n=1 Tax=unclassified Flavobacterium TaxID=196869 RepID=UPI0012B76BAF|nr:MULTISPECIES: RagB/SusD family nutrient uptake outer membrane protein [unclassified Flavobacterium]MBF4514944.1 RagB/SusD family nutrient uptake outer membrane protein [Flavobacterium sp. ANB]MTD68270.1 RagB/SusD family nutrient uptake outer membrane protein [Flavobacterium sp. LC2016-13]
MKISFKYISYFFLFILGISMTLTSCTDDLNVTPKDDDEFLSEAFFKDPASYKEVLAKLYAGLYVGGNDGDGDATKPGQNPDIAGLGGDFSSYLRLLFVTQEFTTDEAIIAWADGTLPTLNTQTWSADNEFLAGAFSRAFYHISVANEFLRQTTDEKLTARGVDAGLKADIAKFRAEARFLRAFSYYNLMDLFGNVPITTENDPVGFYYPVQKSRAEVFAYVESELKDLDNSLVASKANEYGRVDKTAAKFLLAQIYLNSKVYTGVDRNNEAATLCSEIITGSGYTFANVPYRYLFSADNNRNGAESEFIFPIIGDGNAIRAIGGGMSFIMHASIGGSMNAASRGMDGGWQGIRTRREFVNLFPDETATADNRGTFYTAGQSKDINNIATFTDGYAVTKYINVNSDGSAAQRNDMPDIDFPMFRLTDAYLMYAEATLRGATTGNINTALGYINQIRTRANAQTITLPQLTLDFILDERGRELFWECHRRTDLIRFGKFTGGSKIWQWKGGSINGNSTDATRDLMPIPARNIQANPTLKQNPGY